MVSILEQLQQDDSVATKPKLSLCKCPECGGTAINNAAQYRCLSEFYELEDVFSEEFVDDVDDLHSYVACPHCLHLDVQYAVDDLDYYRHPDPTEGRVSFWQFLLNAKSRTLNELRQELASQQTDVPSCYDYPSDYFTPEGQYSRKDLCKMGGIDLFYTDRKYYFDLYEYNYPTPKFIVANAISVYEWYLKKGAEKNTLDNDQKIAQMVRTEREEYEMRMRWKNNPEVMTFADDIPW